MNRQQDFFTLYNGCKIPCIGFGTWKTPNDETAVMAIGEAVRAGYRHIDTAARYGNETSVGEGIKACGLPRESVFVTSKVWNTERGYEKTMAAFEKSCADLGVDYLDLYLIHWPANEAQYADKATELNLETWRAMTELYKAGKVKAIGVSNFLPHHLEPLVHTEVKPMVNQIEYHPGYPQKETVAYCQERDILVEAWSPLGRGRVLEDACLVGLAEKYGVSVAQICLRWCLQNGVLPLPKSVTPERIRANYDVFDFEISPEDMARIDALPEFGASGLYPDKVDF